MPAAAQGCTESAGSSAVQLAGQANALGRENRAEMRLLNVIGVELVPAPCRCGCFSKPGSSCRQLGVVHVEMQPARRNIELSTGDESRDENAGIDRELKKMATTGLAQLAPVPRAQIFDH